MNISRSHPIVAVILAAGRGTRMKATHLPKVCFPIAGVPAIARAVESYVRCGIHTHCVVVGQGAEAIMGVLKDSPGQRLYAHQPEPLGTGHATRVAVDLLRSLGYDGDVLVVAGDKVIEEAFLARLIDTFYYTRSDLAFATGKVNDFRTSGRVVRDAEGKVCAIVEVFDLARAQVLRALQQATQSTPLSAEEARSIIARTFPQEKKAARALGDLWQSIERGEPVLAGRLPSFEGIRVGSVLLPIEQVERAQEANLSVYLFRAPVLYEGLLRLTADNAQGEEYLTDIVALLAQRGAVIHTVPVAYPEEAMAFNTPEELQAIEEYLASQRRVQVHEVSRGVRAVSQWLRVIDARDEAFMNHLRHTYGGDEAVIERKRQRLLSLLTLHLQRFGDQQVVIARAPGRVNIMGRHIDHQGGHVNMIAIDRDVHAVVGLRADRLVCLQNLQVQTFPYRRFALDELLAGYQPGAWTEFVNSPAVLEGAKSARGDWSQYVKAACARLQAHFADYTLPGFNLTAGGDVPIGAGLSSSSAVVVATMEALLYLNRFELPPEQFVELCGEAEWYVGTRGGAGDHAAMKFAQRDAVVTMRFFPLRVVAVAPFPQGYRFLVCHSHQQAKKTAGARDQFNHRVACYHLGREWLKHTFPHLAPRIEHLRDVNTEQLNVSLAELYRLLMHLPELAERQQLLERLPAERVMPYLGTHDEKLHRYPLRPVVVFGLAECERSRRTANLLQEGRIELFARWMNCSHDGDRVARWDEKGDTFAPFTVDYSDAILQRLAERAERNPLEADLVWQPGAYACSTPEIDWMVDVALRVPGVLGAQILGAGLGGCILVLVQEHACDAVQVALIERYYAPRGLEPEMFACSPVAGSGVVA
ncbi:MAG: NTP transferase domain-containing protein [bacterium]|nr:NTP transferase domain-containing protein [bacterium]